MVLGEAVGVAVGAVAALAAVAQQSHLLLAEEAAREVRLLGLRQLGQLEGARLIDDLLLFWEGPAWKRGVLVANGAHVEAFGVAVELLALHAQRFGHSDNIIPAIIINQPNAHVSAGRETTAEDTAAQTNQSLRGGFAGIEKRGYESGGAFGQWIKSRLARLL